MSSLLVFVFAQHCIVHSLKLHHLYSACTIQPTNKPNTPSTEYPTTSSPKWYYVLRGMLNATTHSPSATVIKSWRTNNQKHTVWGALVKIRQKYSFPTILYYIMKKLICTESYLTSWLSLAISNAMRLAALMISLSRLDHCFTSICKACAAIYNSKLIN